MISHRASDKPILQFVSVRRRDSGEWALPGVCNVSCLLLLLIAGSDSGKVSSGHGIRIFAVAILLRFAIIICVCFFTLSMYTGQLLQV